jgi:transposase
MSGDRTSPRFEVVASTRRSFTDAQKREIVAEIEDGATVSEVARRHNVHTSLLFRWRRDFASAPKRPSKPVKPSAFLPVAIVATPDAPQRPILSSAPVMVEIEVRGGRRLRVGVDIDVAALKRIVVALETA